MTQARYILQKKSRFFYGYWIPVSVFILLIGLGLGSWLPTASLLTSTSFGVIAYGTILDTNLYKKP